METIEPVIDYIEQGRERFVEELVEFLKIPSISTSAEHQGEVRRAAEHLAGEMRRIGLGEVELLETGGHPAVYGEWKAGDIGAGSGTGKAADDKPTILIYGHYDVQPVDPLELWESPPFEPQVRGGELYARGSADDKGQVYIHLKAAEAHLKTRGKLPVNLKFIIEGEEESGSPHLGRLLNEHRERLKCDLALISDTPMLERGVPSICVGLRGLCYLEVEVKGPTSDLHSGSFGGAVENPAGALVKLLASLKDADNRVTIPGFYDRVRPLTDEERRAWAALPFDEEKWCATVGASAPSGETGFSTLERIWARPTLDINGMASGFTGEGAKTIIPSWARAKVSMRLVPDQDPQEIADLFRRYLREIKPPTVELTVNYLHGGNPFLGPSGDHPALAAATAALERAFGKPPVLIREGGSIPFVATLVSTFRCPLILIGFGLPDENSHAPNEKLDLENYHRGMKTSAYLYEELSALVSHGESANRSKFA